MSQIRQFVRSKYEVEENHREIKIVHPDFQNKFFLNWMDVELTIRRKHPKMYKEYLSFIWACK